MDNEIFASRTQEAASANGGPTARAYNSWMKQDSFRLASSPRQRSRPRIDSVPRCPKSLSKQESICSLNTLSTEASSCPSEFSEGTGKGIRFPLDDEGKVKTQVFTYYRHGEECRDDLYWDPQEVRSLYKQRAAFARTYNSMFPDFGRCVDQLYDGGTQIPSGSEYCVLRTEEEALWFIAKSPFRGLEAACSEKLVLQRGRAVKRVLRAHRAGYTGEQLAAVASRESLLDRLFAAKIARCDAEEATDYIHRV